MSKAKARRNVDARKRSGPGPKSRTKPVAVASTSSPPRPVATSRPAEEWARLAPTVTYLATHSVPSPELPPRLAEMFCTAPREGSKFHTSRAPLLSWAEVRRIPPGTRCCDPELLAKERSKRLALAALSPTPLAEGEGTAPLHPACGQQGVFALRVIPPHTFLFPYLGVVHTEPESDPESEYDLHLWAPGGSSDADQISLGVDATTAGSYARFVNDFRGVLPRPNLVFDDWSDVAPDGRRVQGIGLFSGPHPIEPGTEMCVSYGKGFWRARADG